MRVDVWVEIAAIAASAAAVFAAGNLLITWNAHRRAVLPAKRPVAFHSIRVPHAPVPDVRARYQSIAQRERLRMAYVRVVNHSGRDQGVGVDQIKSRLLWPMAARHVRVHSESFEVPDGTFVLWLCLIAEEGRDWPTDRLNPSGNFERRYVLLLRGTTTGTEKRFKFRGRVVLAPYR